MLAVNGRKHGFRSGEFSHPLRSVGSDYQRVVPSHPQKLYSHGTMNRATLLNLTIGFGLVILPLLVLLYSRLLNFNRSRADREARAERLQVLCARPTSLSRATQG